ncbi:MAG: hypothetical protein ABFS42_07085 [Candidatus Krumholzibacteriota bacterium]
MLGLVLVSCLAAGGCASTGAPDDWLSTASEAPVDPYGAWVTVEFVDSHDEEELWGEFLAVDNDSLYVLAWTSSTKDPVRGVPLGMVKKAKIAHFDPETGQAIGWVTAGSLSTLSHGLGAAVSLPLWIIMGSAMAGGHSRAPLENYPDLGWSELNMYARFPQGPPPGLHQLGLRPKK